MNSLIPTGSRRHRLLGVSVAAVLGVSGLAVPLVGAAAPEPSATAAHVVINEIESKDANSGPDWVELANPTDSPVNVSGWTIVDDSPKHTPWALPAGSIIPAGGHLVVTEKEFGFGLGGDDAVTLRDGDTVVDSYHWTSHADETWGRCPDATGEMTGTEGPTPGKANLCAPDPNATPTDTPSPTTPPQPWPGSAAITPVAAADGLGDDMSGADFAVEADGTQALWTVNNGTGTLYRYLVGADGDLTLDWSRPLAFPDGSGTPDTEGVAVGPDGVLLVSVERDNDAKSVGRPGILVVDPARGDGKLPARAFVPLSGDLPADLAPNSGAEAVTWLPDADAPGLASIHPAAAGDLPGIAVVGIEGTGELLAVRVGADGSHTLLARLASGFPSVAWLDHRPGGSTLLAGCDDACSNTAVEVVLDSAQLGWHLGSTIARPGSMPATMAAEGFARGVCRAGQQPVWWTDDAGAEDHSVWRGSLNCEDSTPVPTPTPSGEPTPSASVTPAPSHSTSPSASATPTGAVTPSVLPSWIATTHPTVPTGLPRTGN